MNPLEDWVVLDIKTAEAIIDEFLMVNHYPKITRKDVLQSTQKLRHLQQNEPSLSASFCCVPDAEKIMEVYRRSLQPDFLDCPPNEEQQIVKDGGIYKLAWDTKEENTEKSIKRTFTFLEGKVLGVRGSMMKNLNIELSSKKVVICAAQVLVDLPRWGPNSILELNGEEISLSMNLGTILEKIESVLGSGDKFTHFTQFFNQGPFNDMFYSMTMDIYTKWNATLFPKTPMRRSFHITGNKLSIFIKGYFEAGVIGSRGVIEPKPGQKLGCFVGKTSINLTTGAAIVNTRVKVFPETWEKLLELQSISDVTAGDRVIAEPVKVRTIKGSSTGSGDIIQAFHHFTRRIFG